MRRVFALLCCVLFVACGPRRLSPVQPRATQPAPERRAPQSPSERFAFDVTTHATVVGRRATVVWTLKVANRAGHRAREAEFYLEAPPDIAIDQLALDVQPGTLTQGRIVPALAAAAVYERVTRQLIDPALLERVDAQRYRLRIFPLNRQRTVQLRYHTVLPAAVQGTVLEVPRPVLVGEESAWPDSVQLTITQAGKTTGPFAAFGRRLPFEPNRVDTFVAGEFRYTQFQFVPVPARRGAPFKATAIALDHGLETTAHARGSIPDPRLQTDAVVHGAGEWSAGCIDLRCTGRAPDLAGLRRARATDLARLGRAARRATHRYGEPLVLITAGFDRWHDVEWLTESDVFIGPAHMLAVGGWRNRAGLAWLAEQSRGHFIEHGPGVQTAALLAEPRLTELRMETTVDGSRWVRLPASHTAGTPLVLTARHPGPLRARLLATFEGETIAIDLPTQTPTPGDASIKAIWDRDRLNEAWAETHRPDLHRSDSMRAGLVTRTASLAVFERESDYRAATTMRPQDVQPRRPQRVIVRDSRIVILEKIYFPTDGATPHPRAQPIIDAVAQVLANYPSLEIAVIGHTDDREREALRLGGRRAVSVARALIAQGVSPARLSFASHGGARPIRRNTTDDDRAHNRRVEFYITARDGQRTPYPDATPIEFSGAERLAVARLLLGDTEGAADGDLATLRARMDVPTRLKHAHWLYSDAERLEFLRGVSPKGLSDASLGRLADLLAERAQWTRIRTLKLTRHLTDDQLLVYLKAPGNHDCAPLQRCIGRIDAIAAINAEATQGIIKAALSRPKLITPALLRHATEDQVIEAVHRLIARPTVTEADFRTAATWALAKNVDWLACDAMARAIGLSRTVQVPLIDGVPLSCVQAGLTQRQRWWERAFIAELTATVEVRRNSKQLPSLSIGRYLVVGLPHDVKLTWQGDAAGRLIELRPRSWRAVDLVDGSLQLQRPE